MSQKTGLSRSKTTLDKYYTNPEYVNSCITVFLVTSILMQLPSVYMIETYGLSYSVSTLVLSRVFNDLKLKIKS